MSYGEEVTRATGEALAQFPPEPGRVMVVGCSTSEVLGLRIGSASSADVAEEMYRALTRLATKWELDLAFQCCEHLNRAIVVESALLARESLREVSVIPRIEAGGALAAYAYTEMDAPRVVEEIRADYGIDVGSTLIGMHLKRVAVPVRVSQKRVGEAVIVVARSRPPLIGGERATYPPDPGK